MVTCTSEEIEENEENEIVTCADCGEVIDDIEEQEGRVNTDGDMVCLDCWEDYTFCTDCDRIIAIADARENADGESVCERCGDNYFTCEDCNSIVNEDCITSVDDRIVCDTCLNRRYVRCADCGSYVTYADAITVNNEDFSICDDCYSQGDYFSCDNCRGLFSQEHYGCYDEDTGENFCDSCADEREVRAIQEYSYKPEWDYHHTKADAPVIRDRFYLGVELEVENKSGEHSNESIAESVKEIVPAICKKDGSIHYGFEIVFHPQTYNYATTTGKKAIEDCLAKLRVSGFAGHGYGGMHVHVSRSAFSRLHLYKFHTLFMEAENLFTSISQRKREALNAWACFQHMDEAPKHPCRNANSSRYSALNYTTNTIEVRIFNSTLRTDRFFKNLEAVKAAIDYSKQYGIQDMTECGFLRFVLQNRGQYHNLALFLAEHQSGRLGYYIGVRGAAQLQKSAQRRIA